MIEIEELQKLINKEKCVYSTSRWLEKIDLIPASDNKTFGYDVDLSTNSLIRYDTTMYSTDIYYVNKVTYSLENLFTTKSEALFDIKYRHKTKIEILNIPTWKEFLDDDFFDYRFYNNGYEYVLYHSYDSANVPIIRIWCSNSNGILFTEVLNYSNYKKAANLCLKLFYGTQKEKRQEK